MLFRKIAFNIYVVIFAITSLAFAQSINAGGIGHGSTAGVTRPQPGHLFWLCTPFLKKPDKLDDPYPLNALERYVAAFWVRHVFDRLIMMRNHAHIRWTDVTFGFNVSDSIVAGQESLPGSRALSESLHGPDGPERQHVVLDFFDSSQGDFPLEVRESARGRTLNITVGALLAQRVLQQQTSVACRLLGGPSSSGAFVSLDIRIGDAEISGWTEQDLRLAEQVARQSSQFVDRFVESRLLSRIHDRLVVSQSSSAPLMARTVT